jgi:hypothetical protein
VIASKIAAVERREACVPGNNGTRHLQKVPIVTSAVPALRSLMQMREEEEGGPRANQTAGAMTHACSTVQCAALNFAARIKALAPVLPLD